MLPLLFLAAAAASSRQCAPDTDVLIQHAKGDVCVGTSCHRISANDLPFCLTLLEETSDGSVTVSLSASLPTQGDEIPITVAATVARSSLVLWTTEPIDITDNTGSFQAPPNIPVNEDENGELWWTWESPFLRMSEAEGQPRVLPGNPIWTVALPPVTTRAVRTTEMPIEATARSTLLVSPNTRIGVATLTDPIDTHRWSLVPGDLHEDGTATVYLGDGVIIRGRIDGRVQQYDGGERGWVSGGIFGGHTSMRNHHPRCWFGASYKILRTNSPLLDERSHAVIATLPAPASVLSKRTEDEHDELLFTPLGPFPVTLPTLEAASYQLTDRQFRQLQKHATIWSALNTRCDAVAVSWLHGDLYVREHKTELDATSQSPLPCTFQAIDSLDLPRPDIDHWFLTRRACRQYQRRQDR